MKDLTEFRVYEAALYTDSDGDVRKEYVPTDLKFWGNMQPMVETARAVTTTQVLGRTTPKAYGADIPRGVVIYTETMGLPAGIRLESGGVFYDVKINQGWKDHSRLMCEEVSE